MICLYLKFAENFTRIILLDWFWFFSAVTDQPSIFLFFGLFDWVPPLYILRMVRSCIPCELLRCSSLWWNLCLVCRSFLLPLRCSFFLSFVTLKFTFYPRTGFYFRTCEDGAGWHLIPCRISPRSEFFSQAYKNWHIMWGINLWLDRPPQEGGSKFQTIHTPTRSLVFLH